MGLLEAWGANVEVTVSCCKCVNNPGARQVRIRIDSIIQSAGVVVLVNANQYD